MARCSRGTGRCFLHSCRCEASNMSCAQTWRRAGRRRVSGLGIIAGGGELPRAVARSAREAGRNIFVIGLRGAADSEIAEFPHDWISLGEAGRLFRLLRANDCSEVLFTGHVARPKFNELKTDTKGIMLLPRVIAA